LDLDEVPWIERFEATLREHGTSEPDEEAWAEFAENVRRNRGGAESANKLRWMGVLMMLVMLAALGWSVWRYALHGWVLR
jgi:hypothetical protein